MFFLNFWDGPASEKILTFLSLQAAYGSQLWFVLVLWLNFILICNLFFLCWHNLEKILLPIYHALCLPCMLHC